MKKLFVILLLASLKLFPQGWGDQIPIPGIVEPNLVMMDMFTNNKAIYLALVDIHNDVRVYKVDSKGNVFSGFPKTITTDGQFPSITGSNERLYITYLSGSSIVTKYSYDFGNTWTQANQSQNTSGNTCNGIDTDFDPNYGLLITWATADDDQGYYETYYISYNLSDELLINTWKQVTDFGLELGGFPSIAFAPQRVFVGYTLTDQQYPNINHFGHSADRDRINGIWNYFHTISYNTGMQKVIVRDNKLYAFYLLYQTSPNAHYDLKLSYRNFDDNSYTSTSLNLDKVEITSGLGTAVSVNNNLNFAYDDSPYLKYQYFDGTSFSSPTTITTDNLQDNARFGFNAVSNDLYVIWKTTNLSVLQYKQYDATPLIPTNFAGVVYQNHPKITWDQLEPDIQYFEVWRKLDSNPWVLYTTTTNNYYVDNGVQIGLLANGTVKYKVQSKDWGNHLSGYTGEVSFSYYGLNKISVGDNPESFELSANYPNPFNPSTTIKFSIPEKSFVTLKVYDLLGREVTEIVNEELEPGSIEKTFDASSLSSGVYIYRISAMLDGKILFSESKQMLMIK